MLRLREYFVFISSVIVITVQFSLETDFSERNLFARLQSSATIEPTPLIFLIAEKLDLCNVI
jgi:hypothetical protein